MTTDSRDPRFLHSVDLARGTCGRMLLDDGDLQLLLCEEISRTTTFEEQNYSVGTTCAPSS